MLTTITQKCEICNKEFINDQVAAEDHEKKAHAELNAILEKIRRIKLVRVADWDDRGIVGRVGELKSVSAQWNKFSGGWTMECKVSPIIDLTGRGVLNSVLFGRNFPTEDGLCNYIGQHLNNGIIDMESTLGVLDGSEALAQVRTALMHLESDISFVLQSPLLKDEEQQKPCMIEH
ncbi:MAG: hypothetical protein V1928_01005 [Parcubacteria group bacterium]